MTNLQSRPGAHGSEEIMYLWPLTFWYIKLKLTFEPYEVIEFTHLQCFLLYFGRVDSNPELTLATITTSSSTTTTNPMLQVWIHYGGSEVRTTTTP